MKQVIIVFLIVVMANAGRTSQWSDSFTLREPINTIQTSSSSNQLIKQFDLTVNPGSMHFAAVVAIHGVVQGNAVSLIIYEINGKIAADLSNIVRSGGSSIVWRSPASRSGLFIARLQSGSRVKTVRFMLLK
jgi:hypothetical protein